LLIKHQFKEASIYLCAVRSCLLLHLRKRDDQQEGKIKASFALLGQTSKAKLASRTKGCLMLASS
jgi:hypothetical protein